MTETAIATTLLGIRSWERQALPLPTSVIATEILYLTASKTTESLLKTKDLHLSLGYSEARTSEVLRELVADGWLASVPCSQDGRVRRLRATSRMLSALRQLRDFDLLHDLHRALTVSDTSTPILTADPVETVQNTT